MVMEGRTESGPKGGPEDLLLGARHVFITESVLVW